MSTAYPSLCPTASRSWTPGVAGYPTRRFNAINGPQQTRLYGSKAFDATLALEYVLSDRIGELSWPATTQPEVLTTL